MSAVDPESPDSMRRVWLTSDVFGLTAEMTGPSYVNRGNLDARLDYLVRAGRHVVIHGDSKQGKTWLRERILPSERAIYVHCLEGSTPESIIGEALGILGVKLIAKTTGTSSIGGELDLTLSGELGSSIIGKAKAEGKLKGKTDETTGQELNPVGRTPADLSWVAMTLLESNRRLVLEDFHYLDESIQNQFSYLLKALLGYGVPVIVVGVWPEDNFLSYYNGDLAGRVDDVHLEWSDDELRQVLDHGAAALNIVFDEALTDSLIEDAFGNVGLIQRLAETICVQNEVYETLPETKQISSESGLEEARREVATSMGGRFYQFAKNFSRGFKQIGAEGSGYSVILQVFLAASDEELLEGLSLADLHSRAEERGFRHARASLRSALQRVGALQAKMAITPIVLVYNRYQDRLSLVDRQLLFYRRYSTQAWPWDEIAEGDSNAGTSEDAQ